MSIYASSFELSDEGDEEGRNGPAPLVYRRSHLLPSLDDPRGGSLDLANIPGFITQDGRCAHGWLNHDPLECENEDELPMVWPFLRMSLTPVQAGVRVDYPEDTVVLDRSQVEALRDHLTEWLDRAVTS